MLKRFVRMIGGDPNKKKVQELAVLAEEINRLPHVPSPQSLSAD